jgi:aryl-alcohol dehydrogenase-like predicted oxidoreductase
VGCNNFGRQLDVAQARRAIYAALDQGINFFDTADHYGRPRTASEMVVGEVLESRRDEAIVATKFGRPLDDRRLGGGKASYVRSATEDSLKRLRTDRIDLMQLHIPDPATPIAETLGALSDLVAEGKIREIGASNFSVAQLQDAQTTARRLGTKSFVSTQEEYSLLARGAETSVMAECERNDMAFVPYFPLYNGLLTGKYRYGQPAAADTRIGSKDEKSQAAIFSRRNMAIVADLTDYAEKRGRTLLELTYAWLLSHQVIPSVIAGVSSPEQVTANIKAAQWELTAEEIADINRLAPIA